MDEIRSPGRTKSSSPFFQLVIIITAAALVSLYMVVRYSASWLDVDTVSFARAIRSMLADPVLVPSSAVYSHGYGYQALALTAIQFGGTSVATFQLLSASVLMLWLIVPAWLMNREFTGSAAGASLATAILLIQPEFLFPLLRGSHEKFSRGLMFLCLFVLLRTLSSHYRTKRFTPFVFVFYLLAFGVIAFNSLIAFSFIFSIAIALILFHFAVRTKAQRDRHHGRVIQRLILVSLALLLIIFLFMFYLYEPVQADLRLLNSVWDKTAVLVLDVESQPANPYDVIVGSWIHPTVFLLLSAANWILLFVSAAIWSRQSWTWFWSWRNSKQEPNRQQLLLWAFFGAFALLGSISILVDFSDAIAANLQHRVFPSFVMVAAPLAATWLIARPVRNRPARRVISLATLVLVCFLAILSVMKASNDPLVSNKWLFYQPAESQALNWSDEKLAGRTLWAAFDGRLRRSRALRQQFAPTSVVLDSGSLNAETRDYLVSDLIRMRAQRLSVSLPISGDNMITYDNGRTQVYHERPLTPYQP